MHADAHDFISQTRSSSGSKSLLRLDDISRKVFSSNLAHLSVVLLWLSGMSFHGAYFSNYLSWLVDKDHVIPTAQIVWDIVGQGSLNADVGGFKLGIPITSGLFYVWASWGITNLTQIKLISALSMSLALVSLYAAFFHMHISSQQASGGLYKKLKCVLPHHLVILCGLGSLSWAGHEFHVSQPINTILSHGIDPRLIESPTDMLNISSAYYVEGSLDSALSYSSIPSLGSSLQKLLTGNIFHNGSLDIGLIVSHHIAVGVVSIVSGISVFIFSSRQQSDNKALEALGPRIPSVNSSWNLQLSINLGITSAFSIYIAYLTSFLPAYGSMATDYATTFSLFCHHFWISMFLLLGAAAHASIYVITDSIQCNSSSSSQASSYNILYKILSQRDILMGHLIWVDIGLGLHAFGIFIHNDTLQSLGRVEDTFGDSSIPLKPIFATLGSYIVTNWDTLGNPSDSSTFDLFLMGERYQPVTQILGTTEFMVAHIHAFTIHTTALVAIKGVLYSRGSRLVADKSSMGFRYPCDGPGRGGTCQISAWDHLYLTAFWAYNAVSVMIFNYFWQMQSDVWTLDSSKVTAAIKSGETPSLTFITAGDYSVNGSSINGWLRNFLWSESSQVLQGYGSSEGAYSLTFLLSHFVWAFSLMFLFSGRGYWQELIESIVWAHLKLKIVPHIQPRALSISQGRLVGLTHFIFGGIGCTWSFTLARLISFS